MTNVLRGWWGRFAGPRRLGVVFVVVLAVQLGHNVFWLVHNQSGPSCHEKVCVSPRSLERIAWSARPVKISHLALYYLLNQRIPGARLTIPRSWRREKRELEALSRLRVEVGSERLIVAASHLDRLRRSGLRRQRIVRGELGHMGRQKVAPNESRMERYVFLFDETATDYVVAETEAEGGPIFVMPRATYAQVAKVKP